jgi:hypothetical protein
MKIRWTIERAMEEPPPLLHPLAGCDWENFQAHLSSHGKFTRRTDAQRAKSRLAVIARHPFTKMEGLIFSKKVENYRSNQYRLSRAQVDRIHDEWGFALKEWNYSQPKSIEVN